VVVRTPELNFTLDIDSAFVPEVALIFALVPNVVLAPKDNDDFPPDDEDLVRELPLRELTISPGTTSANWS
jgi:hypothetical protein